MTLKKERLTATRYRVVPFYKLASGMLSQLDAGAITHHVTAVSALDHVETMLKSRMADAVRVDSITSSTLYTWEQDQ